MAEVVGGRERERRRACRGFSGDPYFRGTKNQREQGVEL